MYPAEIMAWKTKIFQAIKMQSLLKVQFSGWEPSSGQPKIQGVIIAQQW